MSDSNGTSPSEKCETKQGEKTPPCFICFAPWTYFYRRWFWWHSASLSDTELVFRMAILKNKSQPGFPQLDWQFSFGLNLEAVTSLPQKRELEVLGYTGSQHRGAWYDLFVCFLHNGKLLLKKLHLKQSWFPLHQSCICQKIWNLSVGPLWRASFPPQWLLSHLVHIVSSRGAKCCFYVQIHLSI